CVCVCSMVVVYFSRLLPQQLSGVTRAQTSFTDTSLQERDQIVSHLSLANHHVFTDTTVQLIARRMPTSIEDLAAIEGVGPTPHYDISCHHRYADNCCH